MRYYDSLLAIIQENLSENVKEIVNLKAHIAFKKLRENDVLY